MKFKYELSKRWIEKIKHFEEFANGGMQVTIKTRDGKIHNGVLISNCMWIVAMRDNEDLPFEIDDIIEIYQSDDDRNPRQRGGWKYWDKWK